MPTKPINTKGKKKSSLLLNDGVFIFFIFFMGWC